MLHLAVCHLSADMRLLITGLNGTLAPQLAHAAADSGIDVVAWDRTRVDPTDPIACKSWLNAARPQAIAHLAMGSADWATLLAEHAAERDIPIVFTSTAMVFHHEPDGPHAADDPPNAQDNYGKYKLACEQAVLLSNPDACVARIGWQIDPLQAGNNMLMALDAWQERDGYVAASQTWRPACSFMTDTTQALIGLLKTRAVGVVHLDSNALEGHSFDHIVAAMKLAFTRPAWQLRVNQDYRHDQRLIGFEDLMPPLSARLAL